MTLKELIDRFFLTRKCVLARMKDKDDATAVAVKNSYNDGFAKGRAEGYNTAWKEAHPSVKITLEYGDPMKCGEATYRPYTSTVLEIENPAQAKKGDLLDGIRTRTAIEMLLHLVCDAEMRVAKDTLVKNVVMKTETPAEIVYKDALRRLVENAEFIEKTSNAYSEAIESAKKVLSLDFKDGKADFERDGLTPQMFVPREVQSQPSKDANE